MALLQDYQSKRRMSNTSPPSTRGGVTDTIVRYYRVSILAVAALLVGGLVSFTTLPRSEDPEFDSSIGQVITLWPGVGPDQVEDLLTRPIEEAVAGIDGVRSIDSRSSQGVSFVELQAEPDADAVEMVEAARERIRSIQGRLPQESLEPIVQGFNTAFIPVVIASIHGSVDYGTLDRWAEYLEKELSALEGVSEVTIEGLPERQIHVRVNNERLSQYRIPLTQIADVLAAENARVPGGDLDAGQRRFVVGNPAQLESIDAIGQVILGRYEGSLVRVVDVAEVVETYADDTYRVRTDRQRSVLLAVEKVERTNTVAVGERVRDRVVELAADLPPDLQLTIVSDRGVTVEELLGDLGSNALVGALIVMLTVGLLLGPRQSAVVSVSIPLSVFIAFILMRLTDIDLDQISILGLVLALGMLVDSALVVVENIAIHLEAGEPLAPAVSRGTSEVGSSVVSSALTTVAAFVPLLFLTGDTGSFIAPMPLTLIYSMVGSMIVALTVVPLLCYAIWRRFPHTEPHEQGRVETFFADLARRALRHRLVTVGAAVLALAGALATIPVLGLQFFPKAEKLFFLVNVRLPRDVNLETTDQVAQRVEEVLAGEEQIRDFTVNIGKGNPPIYYNERREQENSAYAQVLVNLHEDLGESVDDYVAGLEGRLAEVAGASVVPRILQQGPLSGAPIQIRIRGDDLGVLGQLADRATEEIQSVPGLTDLRHTLGEAIPRLRVELDKDKAALRGVDAYTFSTTVLTALNGRTATHYVDGENEVPLVVRLDPGRLREVSDLRQLYFPSQDGAMVSFGEIADLREESTLATITRRDGRRMVMVEADVRGRLVADVTADVEARLAGFELPGDYQLEVGGEEEERAESFAGLTAALALAVLLIYSILAIQFNSFVQPFVIILTVPFGLIGAVFGLLVTGNPFGFTAFIGIVSLTGIVINDSIVLTDFVNYLQRVEGKGMYESLLEGVARRARPVILTSVTTIAGMAPLAIWGGSAWSPLATALCFGLATATVLILLICPTLYSLLVGSSERRRAYRLLPRLWRRLVARAS